MSFEYHKETLWSLLRGSLLLLGLLLPLNLPFSIPALESEKRFGWTVAPVGSEAGVARPLLQQVLRHGYIHGVQTGDLLLELNGEVADSSLVAQVRYATQVGDTVQLLVERRGQRLELAVPVLGNSISYTSYFWYRMVIAVVGWAVGMALIAWRGRQAASLMLGAALLLMAPVTASGGVPGNGFLLEMARTGWQIQAAAFPLFVPTLLLHFILLHQREERLVAARLWGPAYIILLIVLLLSTNFLREPMAWTRLGSAREFTAGVSLIVNILATSTAGLMLRRQGGHGPYAARWVIFAIFLVTGTNAILYGARLILGEQNIGELLWRINGSTLILLPITGALYLLLPASPRIGRQPYHRRLASTISVLLTGFYGFSIVGVAAVLLSVSGNRLNGGEWLLFLGIFLATVIFSPVLRWSEEVAGRYILADWKELERESRKFIERIGTELTPIGIARVVAEELPGLLGVPSVSLAISAEAIGSWSADDTGLEVLPRGTALDHVPDSTGARAQDPARGAIQAPGAKRDSMLLPIRYPDSTIIGALRLSARIEPGSPQSAILESLIHGIAAAIRNAENHLRLRQAEQELAEAERVASLGTLASGLAHEIKNPLAGLKMGLYLLERDAVDPQKFIRLQRDLRRIDDLVLGLLRFTHDGGSEESTPLSLRTIIDDCAEEILPLAEDREIVLQIDGKSVDVQVLATPGPLRLLVTNLLRNALDATEPGGVVRVSTSIRGTDVEMVVHDSGPGIPAGLEEQIFELSFSTKPGGTGLGLALARREAQRLGGRIEVESIEGEGTLLRVVLPRLI